MANIVYPAGCSNINSQVEGVMPENCYQRIAKEDGCTYVFDHIRRKWLKVCDVDSKDVPKSVRESIKEDIEKGQSELDLLKGIKI